MKITINKMGNLTNTSALRIIYVKDLAPKYSGVFRSMENVRVLISLYNEEWFLME